MRRKALCPAATPLWCVGRRLPRIAGDFGLGDMLTFARSEEAGNGRVNPSILADALEALIGALYLDGGLEPAERFVRALNGSRISAPWASRRAMRRRPFRNGRRAAGSACRPIRLLETSGPAHAPRFEDQVSLADFPPMTASASSKRQAEQTAAKALLDAVAETDQS